MILFQVRRQCHAPDHVKYLHRHIPITPLLRVYDRIGEHVHSINAKQGHFENWIIDGFAQFKGMLVDCDLAQFFLH